MATIIAALLAFVALILVSWLTERIHGLDEQLKAIHARRAGARLKPAQRDWSFSRS